MTAPRRSQVPHGLARSGNGARSYVLVFALVLAVLALGLFGVLSVCRESVSQSAARAVETARAQPAASTNVPSFPPPLPTATATAPPSPVPGSAASPSPSPTAATAQGRVHTVAQGDTLYGIAQRYGVSLDALMKANDLTPQSVLQIGQRLTIPNP